MTWQNATDVVNVVIFQLKRQVCFARAVICILPKMAKLFVVYTRVAWAWSLDELTAKRTVVITMPIYPRKSRGVHSTKGKSHK